MEKNITEFNINNQCKITLTKVGAEWLNFYNKDRLNQFQSLLSTPIHETDGLRMLYPTDYKDGDVINCSLWELMQTFGGYFYANTEAPFKNNMLIINGLR